MIYANVSNYSDPNLNEITRKAYRDYSNRDDFDFSVTLTFPQKVSTDCALSCMREFFSKLQKRAFGKNALKAIRKEKPNECAMQVGLEDKSQHHFHLRVRFPSEIYFKEGFVLKHEIESIWKKITGSRQVDIQEHYFLPSGYSFFDYSVKYMGSSYDELYEFFWDQ